MTALMTQDIVTVTEDVWLSILNLAPRVAPIAGAESDGAGPTVAGVVHISGATTGAVTVELAVALADRVAASMFRLTDRRPTRDEKADAVGELTNMVGGSLKGLMDGPSHLSLPAVVDGSGYHLRIPRGRTVSAVPFDCDGDRFVVTVVSVGDQAQGVGE